MTVAEAVAEWLHEKGVTHAFGIIGAGNLALWEAISRKGKTEIVCCHHEQAAAMAASFYQRAGGGIGVALVTTGAGSSNCITGVLAAYMDSTPILVISGNETEVSLRGETRVLGVQGYDSQKVASNFCKQSYRIGNLISMGGKFGGEEPDNVLRHAEHTLFDRRQGPVWIDIPRDVQIATV